MIKLFKDLIAGEPVVFVTIVQLVLTAWLGALAATDPASIPLWLAVSAPASVAVGGFYARQHSKPLSKKAGQ